MGHLLSARPWGARLHVLPQLTPRRPEQPHSPWGLGSRPLTLHPHRPGVLQGVGTQVILLLHLSVSTDPRWGHSPSDGSAGITSRFFLSPCPGFCPAHALGQVLTSGHLGAPTSGPWKACPHHRAVHRGTPDPCSTQPVPRSDPACIPLQPSPGPVGVNGLGRGL